VKKLLPFFGALLVVSATAVPSVAQIDFVPEVLTFNTEVGVPVSGTVTIWNHSLTNSVNIVNIVLSGEAAPYVWAWVDGGPSSGVIETGESYTIEVFFDPDAEGTYHATLDITYHVNITIPGPTIPDPVKKITLNGSATEPAAAEPADLIADLIDFYNEALANGTLAGIGRGRSAPHKAMAIHNMLELAEYLIGRDYYRFAGFVLESVYFHVDGQGRPNDFIGGPALGEFQSRLTVLIDALGG